MEILKAGEDLGDVIGVAQITFVNKKVEIALVFILPILMFKNTKKNSKNT